jgi:hypothetical protein
MVTEDFMTAFAASESYTLRLGYSDGMRTMITRYFYPPPQTHYEPCISHALPPLIFPRSPKA